jgi:DNA replication and repair protein RecF
VHLRRLKLRSFRNLKDALLELPPEGVAVVAPNAQGKSNLLEAIYYPEILRSFRGARDAQLVRFGAEHFRIEGVVETGEGDRPLEGGRTERTVAAAWQRQGALKKVTVDGVEPERLSDAIGHLGVVLFSPADLALVNEGPHERRRFLDIALSLTEAAYLPALQRFRQVLHQRNAALREGGGAAAAAWDALLVREGSIVVRLRGEWLRRGAEPFMRAHREISGGEEAELAYQPGIPGLGGEPAGEGEIASAFRDALEAATERERRQAVTVVGPHRDEVRILLRTESGDRPRDLRVYGSGGQRRSAALALRLLEAHSVRERKGREPILLMDDVFAELDEDRSARLLEHLERTAVGQVVLTAPKEGDVRFRKENLVRWGIRDGEVLA